MALSFAGPFTLLQVAKFFHYWTWAGPKTFTMLMVPFFIILGWLVIVWFVENFLEWRVCQKLQERDLCVNCFYDLGMGRSESPVCPECGFSKEASRNLSKWLRWGFWSTYTATYTNAHRWPLK